MREAWLPDEIGRMLFRAGYLYSHFERSGGGYRVSGLVDKFDNPPRLQDMRRLFGSDVTDTGEAGSFVIRAKASISMAKREALRLAIKAEVRRMLEAQRQNVR